MPRTDSTLPGITIVDDVNGLITEFVSTGSPVSLATAADRFSVGCIGQDSSTGELYKNVGTLATPSWSDTDDIGTADIAANAVTDAKFATANLGSVPRTATATVAGLTTGTLTAGSQFVTVTSADANHIIILPAPVVGTEIWLRNAGTGYEIRSSSPTTIAINGGTGADAESAVGANVLTHLICATTTAWVGTDYATDGTVSATQVAA